MRIRDRIQSYRKPHVTLTLTIGRAHTEPQITLRIVASARNRAGTSHNTSPVGRVVRFLQVDEAHERGSFPLSSEFLQ